MEVKGKIKFIGADNQVSASFVKRELVVTTEEQYPQHIMIEFTQDKVDLLDKFKVGEDVNVGINLRGREWINPQGESKYFNSIQGWKISSVGATHTTAPPATNTQTAPTQNKPAQTDAFQGQEPEEDLMF